MASSTRALLGFILGLVTGFLGNLALLHLPHLGKIALPAAAVCGVIAASYSALAFSREIYGLGLFSILGFLLDVSWSLLNTFAGLMVWIPVCEVSGSRFQAPDDNSRRSGTIVYDQNPRGGGYQATTIGNVIAGGWSSHEEVHVWQARLFGPLYLPVYFTNLIVNLLFRCISGDFNNYGDEAYRRISFEDWAYAAGHITSGDIEWPYWILWLLLTVIYVALVLMIFAGLLAKVFWLTIIGAAGLLVYTIVRVFAPGAVATN
jgi:hypothetical protein